MADASPVIYALYSGDVVQDGNIDLTDVIKVYNDAVAYSSGYTSSDLNGDYLTDLSDVVIVSNNSDNFVNLIRP